MPNMVYPETQFCLYDDDGKAVRYYGIPEGNSVPPGFKVGDLIKVCMCLEDDGFPTQIVELNERTFFPFRLDDGRTVKEEELWTVIQQVGPQAKG
jgi:hypothetical protein